MSTKRSFMLGWRVCSLVVLILWTTALGLCALHCSLGTKRLFSVQVSCHSVSDEVPACHGGGSDPKSDQPKSSGSVCYTLKHLFADGPQPSVIIPEIPLFDTAVIAQVVSCDAELGSSFGLRQDQRREWVFTPEVSLGPAHRSLAPPFVS